MAGIVRAVSKPQAERITLEFAHDFAALEHVIERFFLDVRVGIPERTEAILIVLEYIGVDGTNGYAL